PAGYLFKAFLGAVHNCRNVGNDFGPMHQVGRVVARNAVAVLNGGTAASPTVINCSSALPEKAVKAIGDVTLNLGADGGR
ncbi:hypothetical protein, partial [Escherichia coli]|uniref:hypothetical protein n=1 Tax=Escherichia coli TaxID=562 RepID=UPI001BDDA1E0